MELIGNINVNDLSGLIVVIFIGAILVGVISTIDEIVENYFRNKRNRTINND